MLDWVNSDKGSPIPMWDGRLVTSKVDPWREAETWVAKHAARVHDARTVLVFGIAGGFHVDRLCRRYPGKRIIVVEAEPVFLSSPSQLIRDLAESVTIHAGVNPPALLRLADVQAAVKDIYVVLTHPQASRINPVYYRQSSAVLLGRDAGSFNDLSLIRGSACRLPLSTNPATGPASAISVRTIADAAAPLATPVTDETRAWLCLRELLT